MQLIGKILVATMLQKLQWVVQKEFSVKFRDCLIKNSFHLFVVFRLLHCDETTPSASNNNAQVCYCTVFARINAGVKISLDKCINRLCFRGSI